MNQEIPLQSLVHKNEKKYFWLVLIISLVTYVGLIASIIGIFIILGLFALSLFLHALSLGHIRANAVKLTEKQFPEVYGQVKKLCEAMEIKQVPDVYVMESQGILNAFATRFFGRNMVVLYSEIFELAHHEAKDELAFVIAHELAHIKRNHLTKMMFILPAMWIPGIAELYLRACEYTCDRYAAYYINNREAAKRSLTILAVGKELYQQVNRAEYLEQMNKEKGFFVWLSEMLSTHPPLPKRINEIRHFNGYKGDLELKNRIEKAVPYERFVHYGNPAGDQGPDVLSLGPNDELTEWDSKSRSVPRRIGPGMTSKASIKYQRAQQYIWSAIRSRAISPASGVKALQKLDDGNYNVCVVGTGNGYDGHFEAFRKGISTGQRR